MLSSGGLTHRLDRLEKAGLIRREKAPRDGRSVRFVLTEWIARAEEVFRADMANELKFLEPLDTQERQMLAGLLRKLIVGIDDRQLRHIRSCNNSYGTAIIPCAPRKHH